MVSRGNPEPVVPTSKDEQLARDLLQRIGHRKTLDLSVAGNGANEHIRLPAPVARLVIELLEQIGAGNAVSIVAMEKELTTQQAADMLGVSRPFIVEQMDAGKIPFRLVGTHRRVSVQDMFEYKRKLRAAREAVLDELAAEAQRLNMGY